MCKVYTIKCYSWSIFVKNKYILFFLSTAAEFDSIATNVSGKIVNRATTTGVPSPIMHNSQTTRTRASSDNKPKIEASTTHEGEQNLHSNSNATSKGNFHGKAKVMKTAVAMRDVFGAAANEKAKRRSAALKHHI